MSPAVRKYLPGQDRLEWILILSGSFLVALSSFGGSQILALSLLFLVGATFAIIYQDLRKVLFVLLIVTFSFGAHYRFAGQIHYGGAERALIYPDFVLFPFLIILFFEACLKGSLSRSVLKDKIYFPVLLMVGAGLASLLHSRHWDLTLLEIVKYLKGIGIYLIVRHYVRDFDKIRLVIYVLISLILFQSLLNTYQFFSGSTVGLGFLGEMDTVWLDPGVGEEGLNRVGGTLGHPNILAELLLLTLPVVICFMVGIARGKERFIALIASLSGVLGLVLTFSRAAIVLIPFFLICIIIFHYVKRKGARQIRTVFFLMTGFLLMIAYWGREILIERFTASSMVGYVSRLKGYLIAWEMIKAHPLVGVGLNTYTEMMAEYDPTGLSKWVVTPAHNTFILLTSEAGLFGLGAFLFLLGVVYKEGLRQVRSPVQSQSLLSFGILLGLTNHLLRGLVAYIGRFDVLFLMFFFLISLLFAMKDVFEKGTTKTVGEGPMRTSK